MLCTWVKELWRGKSFGRSRLNELLEERCRTISGSWLDLGAGPKPSYWRFLPPDVIRTATDVKSGIEGVAPMDANKPLPYADGSFDGALAMNMLYILEEPPRALGELLRVVKPGGRLIATFAYLFPETPEPHDYWRWTREGVRHLLEGTGWSEIVIVPVGGPWTAWFSVHPVVSRSRIIRFLLAPYVRFMDRLDGKNRMTYTWLAFAKKSSS